MLFNAYVVSTQPVPIPDKGGVVVISLAVQQLYLAIPTEMKTQMILLLLLLKDKASSCNKSEEMQQSRVQSYSTVKLGFVDQQSLPFVVLYCSSAMTNVI